MIICIAVLNSSKVIYLENIIYNVALKNNYE